MRKTPAIEPAKRASAAIYKGHVRHARLSPVSHKLNYRVFACLLDADRLPDTAAQTKGFSYNASNLFSVHDKDHGPGDGTPIAEHVRSLVTAHEAMAKLPVKRIDMLCYPRVLGFAFNPLTVYFVHGANGLMAMVYEVNNTFGERRSYVVPVAAEDANNASLFQGCAKQLYVSPFNRVEGDYTFHIRRPGDEICVGVNYRNQGQAVLKAHFSGTRSDFTGRGLVGLLLAYPLMTLKVVAGIHYEALRLWIKRIPFVRRIPTKRFSVTNVTQ